MAFDAEAGALHGGPSAHPGLVCLFSSRSRPSMSRSARIKRQHGDRDRDRQGQQAARVPSNTRVDPKDDNVRECD